MYKTRIFKFPVIRIGCKNSNDDRKEMHHVKDGSALMASLTFNRRRKKRLDEQNHL